MARETVHLSVDPALHPDTVTGKVEIKAGGEPLTLVLTVPAGPCTTQDVLPVLQGLSSLFAQRGAAKVEAAGRTVSCRAGCGACCRQMMPVTGAEARNLARVVDNMPAPRRVAVRARFDAALNALAAAGLLDRLRDAKAINSADQGMAYFRLGIPARFWRKRPARSTPTARWAVANIWSPRRPINARPTARGASTRCRLIGR